MSESSRLVVVDDTDSRIRYSGTWTTASGSTNNFDNQGNFGDVYQNTLHSTTTSSSSVSFSFTGTDATIYGTTALSVDSAGNSDPDWDCFVDGAISTSAKRPAFQYTENNWRFCQFSGLSAGQHTIQLVVRTRGRAFYIDYIHFRPSGIVENETMFITRDDADLVFNRKWSALAQVAHITHENGGSVTFPFTGTRVALYSMVPRELPHGASPAAYTIDGGSEVAFTLQGIKGTVTEYNRRVWESPQLSSGRHTVTFIYKGTTSTTPLSLSNLLVYGGTNRRAVQAPPNPGGGSSGGGGDGGSGGDNGGNNGGGDNTNGGRGNTGGNGGSTGGGTNNGENGNNGGNNGGDNSNGGSNSGGSNTSGDTTSTPTNGPSRSNSDAPDASGTDRTIYFKPTDGASPGNLGETSLDGNTGSVSTKSAPIGAIVGGILGGLAVGLIAVGIFFFLRQRQRKRTAASGSFYPGTTSPDMAYSNQGAPGQLLYPAYTGGDSSYGNGTSVYSSGTGHARGLSGSNTVTSDSLSTAPTGQMTNFAAPPTRDPFENPPSYWR